MKKFLFVLSAIALLGLTSCVEQIEHNPNYDPETNAVNTNFVFNVSTGNTPTTKMTAANTQATLSEAFRGMINAQLFAYKLTSDGSHVATPTTATKTFSLGEILSPGQIDPDGSPASRRILELAVPLETNTFMFWSKAVKSGSDKLQGKITFNASDADISNHAFSLVPILNETAAQDKYAHYEEMVITLLNKIVNTRFQAAAGALVWDASHNGDGSSNANAIDIYWSDFVNVSTDGKLTPKTVEPMDGTTPISALGEILADAFMTLNTVYDGEHRAGSGSAVVKVVSDMYTVIHKVATATCTSYQEWVARNIAEAIQTNVLLMVDANGDVRPIATLKTNSGLTYTDLTDELVNFPEVMFNLPMGTAQLKVSIDKTAGAHPVATWSYNTDITSSLAGMINPQKLCFPAELCYFGNSPIRVTDDTHITTDYPDGVANWDDDSKWTTNVTLGWNKNGHVKSTTRSIAMQENINYGTSLLKSTIGFKSGVTTLEDNNAAIQLARRGANEQNNTFAVQAGLFTFKGILVAGQPQTVGWNYLQKSADFNYVVWDSDVPSVNIPASGQGDPNYTLVWDNYDSTKGVSDQNPIYVCVELVNNTGKDFWGKHNLIRKDGTFYLVAKLDPAGKTITNWPTKYALPPYATDGSTIQAVRVFIQDYMTTANLVIDQFSLQNAYVTVPDLRSSQISLGLSVDLQWQTGLVFDNVILGQ